MLKQSHRANRKVARFSVSRFGCFWVVSSAVTVVPGLACLLGLLGRVVESVCQSRRPLNDTETKNTPFGHVQHSFWECCAKARISLWGHVACCILLKAGHAGSVSLQESNVCVTQVSHTMQGSILRAGDEKEDMGERNAINPRVLANLRLFDQMLPTAIVER